MTLPGGWYSKVLRVLPTSATPRQDKPPLRIRISKPQMGFKRWPLSLCSQTAWSVLGWSIPVMVWFCNQLKEQKYEAGDLPYLSNSECRSRRQALVQNICPGFKMGTSNGLLLRSDASLLEKNDQWHGQPLSVFHTVCKWRHSVTLHLWKKKITEKIPCGKREF